VVTEGNNTSGVNFSLSPFTAQPPVLSASNNEVGEIILGWILPPEFRIKQRDFEIAKAVGDPYPFEESTFTKAVSEKMQNDVLHNSDLADSFDLLADSVFIYRSSIEGGPYIKIGSVNIGQLNYTDTDVFPQRDYYYVVNIVTDIGQSGYSNEAFGQVNDSLLTFNIEVPEASIPTIDGVISPGEWDDAVKVDISDVFGFGGVPIPLGSEIMYLKFDDNNDMLYIAGEDFLNPTLDDNEGFGFYFDDNNNNKYDDTPPYIQEGNYWAYWHPYGSNLRFRDLTTYAVDTLHDAEVEFSDVAGHLQGEVAIPMGFSEGYELQVFGPDRIVGLGTFFIGRQAGVPVYHGWWPQTMLYLFDPITFGNVGINVSLLAPPQVPSNISVTRQGEDLLLTWNDPILGLNNEPLPVPATIKVYKNGEYLTSFSSGVQSYLDNDVYCVAWYEYQMQAYIIIGSDTLTGPMSSPVGDYACEEPALTPISYDDGTWDAFYAAGISWEKNKFAVRFTPASYPTYLRKVETTVNSNDAFDFTVQTNDAGLPGSILAGPYRVYDTNPATVGIVTKTLPGTDPPEITQGDFWVVINWLEQTPGAPGIGVDATPPIIGRSMQYLTSTGWTNFTPGDIMITAYVSDQPVGLGEENKAQLPLTFDMKQNYPNPFNPSTIINYQLPQSEMVTLEVYDALGQKVRMLVNEMQEAGQYQIVWDGKNDTGNILSSGVYLYRIVAGDNVKVMKMMLLR
jgi:hypothetical protein